MILNIILSVLFLGALLLLFLRGASKNEMELSVENDILNQRNEKLEAALSDQEYVIQSFSLENANLKDENKKLIEFKRVALGELNAEEKIIYNIIN